MSAPKVVFLDIDGVLVNRRSLKERSGLRAVADNKCVYALNHVTTSTGAVIVLASSWRFCGLEEMRLILAHWGVRAELIGCTPDLTIPPPTRGALYLGVPRSREIQAWMDENGRPDSFVILDDDPDADVDGRQIRTQFEVGLTEANAHRAIAILAEAAK